MTDPLKLTKLFWNLLAQPSIWYEFGLETIMNIYAMTFYNDETKNFETVFMLDFDMTLEIVMQDNIWDNFLTDCVWGIGSWKK